MPTRTIALTLENFCQLHVSVSPKLHNVTGLYYTPTLGPFENCKSCAEGRFHDCYLSYLLSPLCATKDPVPSALSAEEQSRLVQVSEKLIVAAEAQGETARKEREAKAAEIKREEERKKEEERTKEEEREREEERKRQEEKLKEEKRREEERRRKEEEEKKKAWQAEGLSLLSQVSHKIESGDLTSAKQLRSQAAHKLEQCGKAAQHLDDLAKIDKTIASAEKEKQRKEEEREEAARKKEEKERSEAARKKEEQEERKREARKHEEEERKKEEERIRRKAAEEEAAVAELQRQRKVEM